MKTKNISLSKLALFEENFDNSEIMKGLATKLDIDLNENINPISNIKSLKDMRINF